MIFRHEGRRPVDCSELEERVHRLEIDYRRLRERLDDLEGRHASLSAQTRGRLGGRPAKAHQPLLVPLGAQIFPPQE